MKLVQRLLKHYSLLPIQPEIAHSLRPLLMNQHVNMDTEMIAQQLQGDIDKILRTFSIGSIEERRFHQILQKAYIQKIGTHERVAESLHLSSPTYYRYLRNAVRKLTYALLNSSESI